MSALRILRVLPFYGAEFGGPVVQARLVNRELIARGHEVRVVSSDLGMPATVCRDAWREHDGVSSFFARARGLARVPPYLPPRAARRTIAAALQSVDVATIHVGLSWWGSAVASACARAAVPFVYNAEGALDPVRLRLKRLQKRLFLASCERSVLRRASALQAVTAFEATCLAQQGAAAARVHVIPNGVELPAPQLARRAAGRARLGLQDGARVVLFLGRRDALKGLDLLLEAAAPLLRAQPDLHLAIVGPPGNADAALRARAAALGVQTQLHLHAAVAHDAKAEVLAAADLFALTSRSEGLPNAALEAAAAGLPLLLTDACHLPEVVAFGAGRQCAVEVGAIAAALGELLGDAGELQRCAAGARRMATERFAITRVVDQLEQLYRQLAAPCS